VELVLQAQFGNCLVLLPQDAAYAAHPTPLAAAILGTGILCAALAFNAAVFIIGSSSSSSSRLGRWRLWWHCRCSCCSCSQQLLLHTMCAAGAAGIIFHPLLLDMLLMLLVLVLLLRVAIISTCHGAEPCKVIAGVPGVLHAARITECAHVWLPRPCGSCEALAAVCPTVLVAPVLLLLLRPPMA
jgi:hypothetical protein